MSFQVPEAFVKQYSSNVYHLSQQKGSRLRNYVRQESHRGEEAFYDRIGQTVAQRKVSRHSDTPRMDTPHDRRRAIIDDYEWADLVDKQDKLRTLFDPTNPYAQSAMYAMGRAIDDALITAATGVAFAGQNGGTPVALPNSQRVVATDKVATAGSRLNVNTLRIIKQRFDANDVDESQMRCIAVTSHQIQDLLEDDQITNADFNTVRALVNGEIDTFMGFKFIRTERLQKTEAATQFDAVTGEIGTGSDSIAAGARKCFAWTMDGILLSIGADIMTDVGIRRDKSLATQVYACMSIGGVRMEEEKVVEFLVNEAV